jgi:hypothetical protein
MALIVKVLSAELTRDTEIFGNMVIIFPLN